MTETMKTTGESNSGGPERTVWSTDFRRLFRLEDFIGQKKKRWQSSVVSRQKNSSVPGLPKTEDRRLTTKSPLLCWDRVELAGRLFVENRSFFRIASAPVLVATGNPQENARPDTLFTGFILV